MKKIFCYIILLLSSFSSFAMEPPKLVSMVNDYANILKPSVKNSLEQELSDLEKQNSTQVIVLTVDSLNGDNIEEFSVKTFNTWKLGQAKLDNGLLLVVSVKDREVRFEVGMGLEGKITDLVSSRIIREEMAPYLEKGDYNTGITKGINSVSNLLKTNDLNKQKDEQISNPTQTTINKVLGAIFIILLACWGYYLFIRSTGFYAKIIIVTISLIPPFLECLLFRDLHIFLYLTLENPIVLCVTLIPIFSLLFYWIKNITIADLFFMILSILTGGKPDKTGGGGKSGGGGASGKF